MCFRFPVLVSVPFTFFPFMAVRLFCIDFPSFFFLAYSCLPFFSIKEENVSFLLSSTSNLSFSFFSPFYITFSSCRLFLTFRLLCTLPRSYISLSHCFPSYLSPFFFSFFFRDIFGMATCDLSSSDNIDKLFYYFAIYSFHILLSSFITLFFLITLPFVKSGTGSNTFDYVYTV